MTVRLLNWNIRQGGTKCLPEILEAIVSHKPDLAVITEFRRNWSGERIRARLSDLGLIHQVAPEVPPGVNNVLIASRFEVRDAAVAVPPDLRQHMAVVRVLNTVVAGVFCATKETAKSFLRFLCDSGNGIHIGAALATGDFNWAPRVKNRACTVS